MRRFASLAPVLCLALTLAVGLFPSTAHADSYVLYNLGDANYNSTYGITDAGTVVVSNGLCYIDPAGSPCYSVWVKGNKVTQTDHIPDLTYDNGVACKPVSFYIEGGRCNGAYDAYQTSPDPLPGEIKVGPIGKESTIPSYTSDALLLDAFGDLAWVDPSQEEIFEAYDVSSHVTPEPTTLTLLGTGCLGFAAAFRRRFQGA